MKTATLLGQPSRIEREAAEDEGAEMLKACLDVLLSEREREMVVRVAGCGRPSQSIYEAASEMELALHDAKRLFAQAQRTLKGSEFFREAVSRYRKASLSLAEPGPAEKVKALGVVL